MLIKNTPTRFGLMAILLHWIMAVLLIFLVALGLYMTRVPISAEKLKYFGWHKELGILALMLVIVRLTWRLYNITPLLQALSRFERIAARSVHATFYLFMFALPLTGWLLTSAADLPVSFFNVFLLPNLVSPSEDMRILFTKIHEWFAYALIVVFCMHVSAALKHFFINKDGIMQRMLRP